ncbi:hypothetical protein SDC9_04261 [bioreactor metagenome]|uniref:MotA/TolQ/ExbB proton channel domain-containing protein n=1 Tax=bioreactor metagenome TaxID=1076179 RepID=A0A644SVJ5_9ZZZZ|nr:MotA/TolQ/ExbB proton channel family protein [Negativicutes bacterium]
MIDSFNHAIVLFAKGGLVMYPLLVCSIIVVAVVIERFLYICSVQTDITALIPEIVHKLKAGNWYEAAQLCSDTNGIVAFVLAQGLINPVHDRQELEQILEGAAIRAVAKLRHRISYLDTIVTLAPLLGLLGTVIGMIQSFSVLTIKAGQTLAITGGVGEALIATATGLCVAIIALVAHSYLNHCIEAIITDIEETANATVTAAVQGWQNEAR